MVGAEHVDYLIKSAVEFGSMVGDVRVLFVNVSVVARPTNVSVLVGRVNVPVFVIVAIIGDVRVLFVSVSVVARPTNLSVLVGRVNVPVFVIVLTDIPENAGALPVDNR